MSPREQSGGGARGQEQRCPEQDEGALASAKERARSRSFSHALPDAGSLGIQGCFLPACLEKGWSGARCVQSWAGLKKPELDFSLEHLLGAQSRAVKSLPSNSFIFPLKFTVSRPSWGKPLATHEALNRLEWTDFPGGPLAKTPYFHCSGHGFHPWSGN